MRFATMTIMIALSLFALVRGANVIGFTVAKAGMFADAAGVDRIRTWQNVSGVEAVARRAARVPVLSATNPKQLQLYTDEVKQVLEVSPLAPSDWLSLAGLRLILSAPETGVVSALNMSVLTGPNEGAVMVQRGMFGLLEWERLPSEAHTQTIRDVDGSISDPASDQAIRLFKGAVASTDAETRSTIRTALQSAAIPNNTLVELGLE